MSKLTKLDRCRPQSFQNPGADQTDRSPWTRRLKLHSLPQGSSLMPITQGVGSVDWGREY